VPEEETFEGQGGHYLRVLALISVILFVGAVALADGRLKGPFSLAALTGSRWFWLYMLIFTLPALNGVYAWYVLRGEQVRINDTYLERRSRFGDERVYWADVTAYRRQLLPFRKMRLGRVARLSQWLTRRRLFRRMPPHAYYLTAVKASGERQSLRLEPGTIGDMDWLLKLIGAQVGEPEAD
jgi:hypothetical protein